MIFGTAPLAYKGMNTKVHYYKRDKNPQIVISKLFTLNNYQSPSSHHTSDSIRRASFSSINSDRSTASFLANSSLGEDNTSEQSSDDDHYSHSYYQPVFISTKRSRKFAQTNMENGLFNPTPLPTTRISAIENVRWAIRFVSLSMAEPVYPSSFLACTTNIEISQICSCHYHHSRRQKRNTIRLYILSLCID